MTFVNRTETMQGHPSDHMLRNTFACILMLGILMGAIGASRLQSFFGTALFAPGSRVVCVFACILIACAFRKSRLPERTASVILAILAAVQVLLVLLAIPAGEAERLALGVASTLCEGTTLALVVHSALRYMATWSSRRSAIAIACAFALVNIWDGFFIDAPEPICTVQWIVGKLCAVGICIWLAHAHIPHVQQPATEPSLPSSMQSALVPTAFVVTFIMMLTGISAGITGLAGTSDNAFFGLSTNIYLVIVRIALVVFVSLWGGTLKPGALIAFGSIGIALGMMVTACSWATPQEVIGAMIVQSTLYALQPLILIFALRSARLHVPSMDTVLLCGIAVCYSNHIVRLAIPFVLIDHESLTPDSARLVLLMCLGLLAMCLAAYNLVATTTRRGDPVAQADAADIDNDPLFERQKAFTRQFRLCAERADLTQREAEVFWETVHGKSSERTAQLLGLSSQTVKTYLSRTYAKLGVHSKQEALALLDSCDS